MNNIFNEKSGFSLVEAILSLAIFALLVTALVGALSYGVQSPQIAGAHSRALLLADEGLEAARNIRDTSYAGFTAGTYGLAPIGGIWTLSGIADSVGIFYRHLDIASLDSNRKIVTSTVEYSTKPGVTSTVSLATYITNWRRTVSALGGLLIYGDGTTMPKYRIYDSTLDVFSAEASSTESLAGITFIIRASPKGPEAIAGFVTATGALNVLCYDGTSWFQEWTAAVGGTGATRRFDIAYETASGDAMVLYSANVATNNELHYQALPAGSGCGSANWSAENTISSARTTGVVQWVKMAWDRRSSSNLITAIWADANSDLSAMVWSGSAWGNEPSTASATALDTVASAQDVENFDVEYESVSGDVMMVWGIAVGKKTNGVRYRVCTGGTAACAWGAVTTPPTFADDAVSLDLSANPNTDEMAFASIGTNQNDLQIGYWSGSAWTNKANADTSCNTPIAGSKLVAAGWLISGATTRSIIRYADQGSSAIDWYVGNNGSFAKQTDFTVTPAPTGPIYYDVQMNPLSQDQLMSLVADGANGLFAKRLIFTAPSTFTWTNSDAAVLEAALPQSINSPFSFAYWRI